MANLKIGGLIQSYRVVEVLGAGGFGVTYLVKDEQLDKFFAMKEYFPADFAQRRGNTVKSNLGKIDEFAWGKERFVEEARVLARFQHPNIVGVARIFDANNTSYMVQEYQRGRSLKQWLAGIEGMPTQDELDLLLKPLLDALEVIHNNDVLHRDIAPDNIYIRDDGTPVLLDFGSAREAVAQRTKTISAIVKSGYSPAEQYSTKGKSQGPWSDIYALAATLYRAVTGAAPDEATDRVTNDEMVSAVTAAKGKYREGFLKAIDWALQVAPINRPQSISAWREALFSGKILNIPDAIKLEKSQLIVKSKSKMPYFALAACLAIAMIGAAFYLNQPAPSVVTAQIPTAIIVAPEIKPAPSVIVVEPQKPSPIEAIIAPKPTPKVIEKEGVVCSEKLLESPVYFGPSYKNFGKLIDIDNGTVVKIVKEQLDETTGLLWQAIQFSKNETKYNGFIETSIIKNTCDVSAANAKINMNNSFWAKKANKSFFWKISNRTGEKLYIRAYSDNRYKAWPDFEASEIVETGNSVDIEIKTCKEGEIICS